MNLPNLFFTLWLCGSVFLSFSSKAVDCSTDTTGLCTPTVEEIIEEVITETIEFENGGITTTTTTETTTTTTTITNENSGDILDGENGYVTSSKEGDMDIDWGGQGPASMPSGEYCNQLGTDKCAEITGGSSFTSTMGVENVGTTFIQTVDISDLNIKYGGETNYSIKVDKQDAQDSVYMHITGKDGSTEVFSGTDILSASGTASGFQTYESSFDFSGNLTTVIIEIGGRDINLSVGPLFDDVTVNVLYNVINTIVTQTITSVEMFVLLNTDASEEIIDVVEDIFDSNITVETDIGIDFAPIEEPTYEEIEIEIAEIEIAEIEIEAEIEATIEETISEVEVEEDIAEPEQQQEESTTEENETENDIEIKEVEKQEPEQTEDTEKEQEKTEQEKQESSKEKAVKKIMKKIDDKKRYDDVSQTKTLIVMQVLGDTKSFFADQQQLIDRVGFFTDKSLPDTMINDNDLASYFLFVGSDGLMNELIESQWQQR
jgi:hypothetical protein